MKKPLLGMVFILVAVIGVRFVKFKEIITETTDIRHASESRRALDLLQDIRTYPNQTIPDEGIALAFDYSKKSLRKATQNTDLNPWLAIGPRNIGGRTLAIALNPLNPNTVYAGAASGGLWRSYSEGVGENAWEHISTGFPVLGVAAIAIAPNDSNTIYIGTGEVYGSQETFPGVGRRTTRGSYGIGILKTSDGGQTWVKSLDWLYHQQRGVQKIRIDPLQPNTVWAATTEGTFKSLDAGGTWELALDVVMATDIAINPVNPDIVFVACGGMGSPGHGVYRTQDGGVTWQKLDLCLDNPETFYGKAMLGMSFSEPNVMYVGIGNYDGSSQTMPPGSWICKSIDSGDSWSLVFDGDYTSLQGWYSHDIAVNPQNPDEFWAAGLSRVPYLSNDGGDNVQRGTALGLLIPATGVDGHEYPDIHLWPDYHEIVFHPANPQIIYFANDGGIFRTSDGGKTTENCNGGYQTTQFYNGTSSSPQDSLFFIGGMQDNMSAAYEGDLHWRRVGFSDGSWTAINAENDNTIYLSSQRGNIRKYTNRGGFAGDNALETARPQTAQLEFDGQSKYITNFITPYILSPVDNSTLYFGTATVQKSIDGAESWFDTNSGQPLDGNPVLSMAGSYQSADVVYAATSPIFSRSHVFKTVSGGDLWQDITGHLPDRYPTDLAIDPNSDQNICITFGGFGTSHVFKSNNGGQDWIDIGSGLPDAPTWSVTIDPDFSDHIYVGNDIGVYVSLDGGQNWQEWMDGLPDAILAMDLSISPSSRAIRVATHGNGVFERKLLGEQATSVADYPIADDFQLRQNYPNPFNPSTTIEYSLQRTAHVLLKIYNVRGQDIRTLVNGLQASGRKSIVWDGKDDTSLQMASGVYIYKIQVGSFVQSRRMILLK